MHMQLHCICIAYVVAVLPAAPAARPCMQRMNQTDELPSVRDQLRHAGLRATRSRIATLALLLRERRPMAHVEVTEALEREDAGCFDRTTVFRNLVDLTEAGLLVRHDLGDRTWRFEPGGAHDAAHAHFICTDCGGIECLDGVEVRVVDASREVPVSVHTDAVDVHIRGRCDACQTS